MTVLRSHATQLFVPHTNADMNGQEAAQLALAKKRQGEVPVEKTEAVSVTAEDDSSFHTVYV